MAKGQKFDVKQFLLQRGEFVGLGVAGAIVTILLILAAMKGFSSPGPGANANVLNDAAKRVNTRLQTEKPDEEWVKEKGDLKALAHADKPVELADTASYRAALNYFFPPGQTDAKRRGVTVMAPTEFQFRIAHAQLRSYQLRGDTNKAPDKVLMLKGQASAGTGAPG